MHTGNQKALAVTFCEKFHGIGHPGRSARENDDTVGITRRLLLIRKHKREKPDESGTACKHRDYACENCRAPSPPRRRSTGAVSFRKRWAAFTLRRHDFIARSPTAILPRNPAPL